MRRRRKSAGEGPRAFDFEQAQLARRRDLPVFANCRPRHAAALIIIDHGGHEPRIIMGRRSAKAAFLPGMFVFPGGRLEPADYRCGGAGLLSPEAKAGLSGSGGAARPAFAKALAAAALREAREETGLAFCAKTLERLGGLAFIARAITPPFQIRRFDTRFFAAPASAIAFRNDGDGELSELSWLTFRQARAAGLHPVTRAVLGDAERRFASGFTQGGGGAPCYLKRGARYARSIL